MVFFLTLYSSYCVKVEEKEKGKEEKKRTLR